MLIYLIGFMGSGKSAKGKKLANLLHYQFLDLDAFITEQTEMSIPAIFEKEGEDKFRQMESEALKQTALLSNTVIATGGGAPCFNQNMELIKKSGVSVYLQLSPDELYNRLINSHQKRPLIEGLEGKMLHDFISNKLKDREPYYLMADYTIHAADLKPEEIIKVLNIEY